MAVRACIEERVKSKEGNETLSYSSKIGWMGIYSWWIVVKRGNCLNSARADANMGGRGELS